MIKDNTPEIEDGQLNTKATEGSTSLFFDGEKGGVKRHSDWFRGPKARRNPTRAQMVPHTSVVDHVLDGWTPDAPCITHETRITAFGSCFAANISQWLGKRNYRVSTNDEAAQDAYVVSIGEGMVNSFVIRQQFEWAWEGKTFEADLWRGYDKKVYGHHESVRQQTKTLFDNTDVFILTFGLSEVWYDAVSSNVFWRTVPKEHYDPERHLFRVSTVEENRTNMDAIYQLIRKHRPDAKIIFTLSPVPLIATFRENSCITSTSVSKSILRVAIDEIVREHKDDGALHYWPSYEFVMDVFRAPFKEDRRHLSASVLAFIMTQFEHSWCVQEEGTPPCLLDAWIKARIAAGFLPMQLWGPVLKQNGKRVRRMIEKGQLDTFPEPEASEELLMSLVAKWESEDADKGAA